MAHNSIFISLPASPDGISITNSLGTTSIESGTTITYTCTSTGGNPTPHVEFYLGDGSWDARQLGPTVDFSFPVAESMHGAIMTCRAVNEIGDKNATETLAVFSKNSRQWPFERKADSY